MIDGKIGIGIIGCGVVAQLEHIPAFKKLENVEILALCDHDEVKASALAKKHGIRYSFDDFLSLLRIEEIDGVVIATPNYLHHPMTLAALSYGKHVLCEKPMAMNVKEAKEMQDTARREKKILQVGFNHRFRADVQVLKKFIEGGDIGEIFYIKTGWLRQKSDWNPRGWVLQKQRAGGGVFLDLGAHMLDLALWVSGSPKVSSVSAATYKLDTKGEVEDSAAAFVKLKTGATLTVEVSWTLLYDKDFIYVNFFGTQGAALLNPLRIHKELHGSLVNVTPMVKLPENTYRASYESQAEHFVNCILRGVEPIFSGKDGVNLTAILEAIYTSAKKKREVHVF